LLKKKGVVAVAHILSVRCARPERTESESAMQLKDLLA
jgi:hypothetical protein